MDDRSLVEKFPDFFDKSTPEDRPLYLAMARRYRIAYDDGRVYFRCGLELIEILDIDGAIAAEVVRLIGEQATYYEELAG